MKLFKRKNETKMEQIIIKEFYFILALLLIIIVLNAIDIHKLKRRNKKEDKEKCP